MARAHNLNWQYSLTAEGGLHWQNMILSHLFTQKCAPAQVAAMYIVMTRYSIMQLQWNLHIEDTSGTQLVVLY